jgi:tRNA (guanine-N(7)-)-methyltransferase
MALASRTRTEQFHYSPLALISAATSFTRVEIDIGCGDGEFLAQLASRQPGTHFIGVEVASALARLAAAQVAHQGTQNVTIINGEAEAYINNLPDESVDALHIYFPTPFPLSIGLPTRLVTQRFARCAYRVLRTNGIIRLLTDRKEYHKQVIYALHSSRIMWRPIVWRPVTAGQLPGQLVGTYWERRVIAVQERIWSHCVLK